MKVKIIILTTLCFILSNCDISVRKSNAQERPIVDDGISTLTYSYEYNDGMKYKVYRSGDIISSSVRPLFIINLTKDSLECIVLRMQAIKLRKELSK